MTMQNAPHDDHILAPSDAEVQGMVDGLAAGMDDELRRIFHDAGSPVALPARGNRIVARDVRAGRNPLA
jgi:hypothetical protein